MYRSASDANREVKSLVGNIRSLLFPDPSKASPITLINTEEHPRVQSTLRADKQIGFHNSSISVFDCRWRFSRRYTVSEDLGIILPV